MSKPSARHQDTAQSTKDTTVGKFWTIRPIVQPAEAKLQIPQQGGSGNGNLRMAVNAKTRVLV
jgi:hypothetical protein